MSSESSPPALKIALCKSFLAGPVSGADETLVTYAIELHSAGYDVTVLLLYPFSPTDGYYVRLRDTGVRVVSIVDRAWIFALLRVARAVAMHIVFVFVLHSRFPGHVRRLWQALLRILSKIYYRRCRAYLERHDFDLLHLLTPDAGTAVMIRAAHAAGLPTLYQELGTRDHVADLAGSYQRLARVSPMCTEITALSPKLAREWGARLPNDKAISVLPLIVTAPRQWQIPRRPIPHDVIFGFAARVEAAKGPAILLEAFASLTAQLDRPYLRIAGVGPQSYSLRALSRSLGIDDKCDFVGSYDTAEGRAAFMQTLDVFVLPSFAEGTPNSIIEAMASGVPVIATTVGGIPDIVTPETGILVAPGDAASLAAAMTRLAEDAALRARMGEAARRRYQLLFSPQAVMPLLIANYERVAGRLAVSRKTPLVDHPWQSGAVALGHPYEEPPAAIMPEMPISHVA